ncbi:MAG: NUDIX hydrolase [bacterium]
MADPRDPIPGEAAGDLPEVVDSRAVYAGRVVALRVDEITLPRGGTALREVVDHPGAVVVVAIDAESQVYLVRQYRHPIRQYLLELPAGGLEPDEEPLAAAMRELREEVGLVAQIWTPLGSFFSSPGFANERLHAFLARGLARVPTEPDDDEDIRVVRYPLTQLLDHLEETPDAKTMATLLLAERALSDDVTTAT